MTRPTVSLPDSSAHEPTNEAGYVSSLAPRPHVLVPPGPVPPRWHELEASLAWIVGSWLRPGDTEAGWQQRAGREDRTP